jgi:protein subunit release factor A
MPRGSAAKRKQHLPTGICVQIQNNAGAFENLV